MEEMTIAMQNYLELIYELSLDGKKARVSDIARQLGVSKPSVNNAVVVLAKMVMLIMKNMQISS